jgi:hypothetical protein
MNDRKMKEDPEKLYKNPVVVYGPFWTLSRFLVSFLQIEGSCELRTLISFGYRCRCALLSLVHKI